MPADIYRRVAELHARNIDQSFLSSLGCGFLALLYESIDKSPAGVLCLAERGGSIVGFVAGATRTRLIFAALLRRAPSVALALLPAIFSLRTLRKLGETLLLAVREPQPQAAPCAELLSLAVDQEFRGAAIADDLYARLSDGLRERGADAFRILVGERLAPAQAFYRRMGAVQIGLVEAHRGERSIVYMQALNRDDRLLS